MKNVHTSFFLAGVYILGWKCYTHTPPVYIVHIFGRIILFHSHNLLHFDKQVMNTFQKEHLVSEEVLLKLVLAFIEQDCGHLYDYVVKNASFAHEL